MRGTRASWQLSERTWRLLLGVAIAVVVALLGSMMHPPYVINRAGPAVNTLGELGGTAIIEVADSEAYPTEGALAFTTVAQYGGPGFDINVWMLLGALVDPEAEVLHRNEVFPQGVTRQEVQDATSAQMAGSQNSAEAVALEELGYSQQAVVRSVMADGPAHGILREGDVITAVDRRPVTRTAQVSDFVQQGAANTPVALTISRGGATSTVQVGTSTVQGRRIIGVGLEARFPEAPEVTINAGHVGGPSAGMIFALGIYDKLTPGALTGGASIAGTGTMALDGAVGAIGGIGHKMAGAAGDGAQWFLVPAANCAEAAGNTPDGLAVVEVATFEEALHSVEEIAAGRGTHLPTCG